MSSTRGLLIGAEEVQAQDGSTFLDTDPFTGDLVSTVAASRPADVTRLSIAPTTPSRVGLRPRRRSAGESSSRRLI
jgi:hypothetical protein